MTAIAGISDGKSVWIGADSAGVSGYSVTVRADTKVFRNGPYLFGFAGSFRFGQLAHYAFDPPRPPGGSENLDEFLVTKFVDRLRETLKEGGMARKKDGEELVPYGSAFLLGVSGRLFVVESDFQVGEQADRYAAIGVGEEYALGSLHATKRTKLPPRTRVLRALEAAAYFSGGVSEPFTIARLGSRR